MRETIGYTLSAIIIIFLVVVIVITMTYFAYEYNIILDEFELFDRFVEQCTESEEYTREECISGYKHENR